MKQIQISFEIQVTLKLCHFTANCFSADSNYYLVLGGNAHWIQRLASVTVGCGRYRPCLAIFVITGDRIQLGMRPLQAARPQYPRSLYPTGTVLSSARYTISWTFVQKTSYGPWLLISVLLPSANVALSNKNSALNILSN